MDPIDNQLRLLRFVHVSFLIASGLYVWIGTIAAPKDASPVDPTIYAVLGATALFAAIAAFMFKAKMTDRAEERMRENAVPDTKLLLQWRAGYIIAFACSEAVVLFGFVLLFLGATQYQALPFYVVGIMLLLLFTPRRPQ